MAKTKEDKRINKIVKHINKALAQDVFGDRFWIRQVKKAKGEDNMQYYLYEMKDRQEPNRDSLISAGWIWGGSFFINADLYEAINDFIIRSSFWSKYFNDPDRYNFDMDYYAHDFYSYHTKNK